jgi:hypothetical protein
MTLRKLQNFTQSGPAFVLKNFNIAVIKSFMKQNND